MRSRLFLAGLVLLAVSACVSTSPTGGGPGYLVFFAERSAVLEPTAAEVIARAAAAAQASPAAQVVVLGWTDSDGSPQADVVLSQLRARHVADALVRDGVASARIVRQGRGQTHGDPGVESRRVDIRIGG